MTDPHLKAEAVVQPIAISAPIWSDAQHESQLCEPPALLPIHLSMTVGTSPMFVSRETKEQSREGMSSVRRLLLHNPYQPLDYVGVLYPYPTDSSQSFARTPLLVANAVSVVPSQSHARGDSLDSSRRVPLSLLVPHEARQSTQRLKSSDPLPPYGSSEPPRRCPIWGLQTRLP